MSPQHGRIRTRENRVPFQDHLDPDGKITLGSFRDKATGSINFVPWESWTLAPLYNTQRYQPESLLASCETTLDEIHPGPPYKVGGDFRSIKFVLSPLPSDGVFGKGIYHNVSNTRRYEGGFLPPQLSSFFGTWSQSFDSIIATQMGSHAYGDDWFLPIDDWGYKGWKATKPKLERAGAYVFLREAKDIPRMIVTTKNLARDFKDSWEGIQGKLSKATGRKGLYRTNNNGWEQQPKRASDQFLNEQFGWAPFLNDLLSFDKVYQNGAQYIAKLVDRNDRFVRRRVPLADWTDVSKVREGTFAGNPTDGYALPIFPVTFPGDFFVAPPTYLVEDEVHHQVKAVGKFKFYNPAFNVSFVKDGSPLWATVMRYLTIYGLRPSPSNIYKAIPWTWLIDWFVDASRYIDAISDSLVDQVVCEYYYVTYHRTWKRSYYVALPFNDGTVNLQFSLNVETKERKGATSPYDFALGWNVLSPRQLAILAALKISRT